jgi:uncharacterized protein YoxC
MIAGLFGSVVFLFFFALYVIAVVVIVYLVVSALNRIGRGLEDIAQTLRRIESRGPQ